jgi:hypothetical protein
MKAFTCVFKKELGMLEEPIISCMDAVVCELRKVLIKITEKTMARYPILHSEAIKYIDSQLRICEQKCKENLLHEINREKYINIKNTDFIKS